jgi:hypothetical protein
MVCRWKLRFVFALLCCVGCASGVAQSKRACGNAGLYATARVDGFVFKSYEPLNLDQLVCMVVYRHGREVYRLSSSQIQRYDLGQPGDADLKIPHIVDGTDLNGRGHPDMIVSAWSGGAHCCITRYVFELEPKLRVIVTIADGDSDLGHFERRADGAYEYQTADIWSYWPASFAGSVSHAVKLRWHGDTLRLDMDGMKAPVPTPQQWCDALHAVDAVVKDNGTPDALSEPLWDKVLDLIYTGHSELAWRFVREVNPAALQGNNPSLADFCEEMTKSRYWPELKPTLREVPAECSVHASAASKQKSSKD